MISMMKLIWILSHHGTYQMGIHITMTLCIIGGSLCELIANLLETGTFGACTWIGSRSFNLDDWSSSGTTGAATTNDELGWRVLQMICTVTSTLLLWIDSIKTYFYPLFSY
jgi:hypothetical protein